MLVGEAPGESEEARGEPFVGASGQELNRMLHEAGISRSECFITNVCRVRPPGNDLEAFMPKAKKDVDALCVRVRERMVRPPISEGVEMLRQELLLVKPNVVVAFGNLALWALTGKWGITDWRGSLLRSDVVNADAPKVIPTYHPAAVLRQWAWRPTAIHDLRKVARECSNRELKHTDYSFVIRPHYAAVKEALDRLEVRLAHETSTTLAVDIETRRGHIACLGIAWNTTHAICIPFMCVEDDAGYWNEAEEVAIVQQLSRVLTHPNVRVVGQNFIYDTQYILRHLRFTPRFERDTMLAQHVSFPGTPKGLDYLSSLYCEHHVYWKAEGKEWHVNVQEDQLWAYNGKDCVITYEVDEVLQSTVDKLGIRAPHDFQQRLFYPALRAMQLGVRIDQNARSAFAMELSGEISTREQYYIDLLGHPLNPRSPKQMQSLFYEDLKQKVIRRKGTFNPTLDDGALSTIALREPLLRPLIRNIQEHRSLGVFLSTFVKAPLDTDGRMRCSYNIGGTETFRLSSSENPFGSGTNLQNIPKGGSTDKDDPDALRLPNVRKLFIPDVGFTFWDLDLDRADLQVVVAEAGDAGLRAALDRGLDMHLYSARDIYALDLPDDEIVESHPKCAEHKERYYRQRQGAKQGVHATNYGCGPNTLAKHMGCTVHEADKFQRSWFTAHPGIKRWHERVEAEVRRRHAVTNKFGYTRHYFDRAEGLLPEALAWVPQSTVACVINRAWEAFYLHLDNDEYRVQTLLQVHDSLAGQMPTHLRDFCCSRMRELARIVIPYDDPLIIPVGIKLSDKSWGDCK